MSDLAGKIAVITGGETGIGRGTVEALGAAGVQVVIGGMLQKEGDDTVEKVRAAGGAVEFRKCDVRDVGQVNELVDSTVNAYGRIDIMINNASVFDGFAGCLDTSDSLWGKVIDINLRGTFFGCRAALKHMVPVGYGRIINMASVGGLIGGADGLAYTASKFGIIGITRQIAVEFAAKGVAVNAICPGMIQTNMRANSTVILGEDAPPMRGVGVDPDALKRVPILRKGDTADIANAVLFLASDKSGYINGHSLVVDGGWTIK
jgi:NAD(P)-dependent dehydrogenase (short-subunit alcohol dehydrogenase family)